MSGLIFALLLGAASLTALSSTLRAMGFEEVAGGWRGYVRVNGRPVRVLASWSGDGTLRLILPERSVPEDVCREAVRRLSSILYTRMLGTELPPERVFVVGPSDRVCQYCLGEFDDLYLCPRCFGMYCAEHRRPEDHDCPGGDVVRVGVPSRRRVGVVLEEACG